MSGTEWEELDLYGEPDAEPDAYPDEIDESGYDPADDPAAGEPTGSAEITVSRGLKLPMAKAAIPAALKAFGNGKLTADQMIKVAPLGGTAGMLVPEAAAAWRNLQNAASAAGFTLTMTGAYRSYEQQEWLFRDRYTTEPTGEKSKTWNGTTYWKKPKVFVAAVPGTSNHGWGCAVDMALGVYGNGAKNVGSDPKFMPWAVANAAQYGWSWEEPSEAHHIRLVSIDAAKIIQKPHGDLNVTGTQAPRPTLAYGQSGGQIAALQTIIARFGWADPGRADGTFGPRTKTAVEAMQKALGAKPDGEYGPVTARKLQAHLDANP